jgi:hypothetical protein
MHEDWGYTFCVTNSHVIREAASPIVRLNTKDGGKDIIEFNQDEWVHHQDGDDLAVCLIGMANPDYYKYSVVPVGVLVTEEFVAPALYAGLNGELRKGEEKSKRGELPT